MKRLFIEDTRFTNYMYAKSLIRDTGKKLAKNAIAIFVSIIAMLVSCILFTQTDSFIMAFAISTLLTSVIYTFAGAWNTAIKIVLRVGIYSWYINRRTSIEMIVKVLGVLATVFCLVINPIAIVIIQRVQIIRDEKGAEHFLGCYDIKRLNKRGMKTRAFGRALV